MDNKKIDFNYFKDKLLQEQERIITELKSVGRINPDNPSDWEPVAGEISEHSSDKNDQADNIEQYEQNTAILKELEEELQEVKHALEKIANGTYGICEESGKPIPIKRLKAYPAARKNIK